MSFLIMYGVNASVHTHLWAFVDKDETLVCVVFCTCNGNVWSRTVYHVQFSTCIMYTAVCIIFIDFNVHFIILNSSQYSVCIFWLYAVDKLFKPLHWNKFGNICYAIQFNLLHS